MRREAAGWRGTYLQIIILVENIHAGLELDRLLMSDCWRECGIEKNLCLITQAAVVYIVMIK